MSRPALSRVRRLRGRPSRFPLGVLLLVAPLAFGLGCGDDDDGTGVAVPALEVRTATGGVELDPDGYTVRVDAAPPEAVGLTDTLFIDPLPEGAHSVLLAGLAANCTVAGENPRTVTTAAGRTEVVSFAVTCAARSGVLVVTTATTGEFPDPNGYILLLDGVAQGRIGRDTTTLTLAAGAHTVGLSDVAGNCTVQGENPRGVEVVAGDTATASFEVACVALPPSTGALRVTTASSGSPADPDGYTLALDGGAGQPIGLTDTLVLTALAAGPHTAALTGLAVNCAVEGDNPRAATVVAGDTVDVSFVVTCAATAGAIEVITTTTGETPDPDGYRVRVDDATGVPIGVNDTLLLSGLPPGAHQVRLVQVAANCAVEGENPRTVEVTAGGTARVGFTVTCAVTTGAIRVTATTTGEGLDPNGYRVLLDSTAAQDLGIQGSYLYPAVAPGAHQVELRGVAVNCTVAGENPRAVTVTAGDTAAVAFAITCVVRTGTIVVTTTTTGDELDPDGYAVAVDSGTAEPIPTDGSRTFAAVPVGPRVVTLSGLAANCTVAGENPRTVTVTFQDTVAVAFAVSCEAAGLRWDTIPLPPNLKPGDVWASGPSDIFVTGSDPNSGVILHYDGSTWTEQYRGQRGGGAVWGFSPTEVFAVLGYGDVLRHDGGGWVSIGPSDYYLYFESLWGSSPRDLYAGGVGESIPDYGVIQRYDGENWSGTGGGFGTYGRVNGIAGTSPSDVYAVGEEYSYDVEPEYHATGVEHFDGAQWTRVLEKTNYYDSGSEDDYTLEAIWANARNDVFVVGTEGHISHYDGASWSPMASGFTWNLWDVWGRAANDVYAVGSSGVVRYNGRRWTVINNTPGTRVWGTTTDLFVVAKGAILHASP